MFLVNIPGYIALVGEEDYAGAINLIRKDNPFPTACAMVCEHPCEERCRRKMLESPINIRALKKYAVDMMPVDKVATPKPNPSTGKSIGVIGGGPAGLTAAYFLALMGHKIEVYETHDKLGGMLRYGIPNYRFPKDRLDEDIRAIYPGIFTCAGHKEIQGTFCPMDSSRQSCYTKTESFYRKIHRCNWWWSCRTNCSILLSSYGT